MVRILCTLFLCLIGLCAGCQQQTSPQLPETEETAFRRGQRLLSEERPADALAAFLNVIDARPDAASESHLEAGRIYLNTLNDPVAAIYHFRRYLEIDPDSERAALVEGLIQTARKEFAKTLPGAPFEEQTKRLDLLEMLEVARKRNLELRESLAKAEARIQELETALPARNLESASNESNSEPSAPETASTQAPVNQNSAHANATTYTVQSGDTLYKIAQKVYGETSRWMDIYQANRDVLPSPHALRLGQTLKIPR